MQPFQKHVDFIFEIQKRHLGAVGSDSKKIAHQVSHSSKSHRELSKIPFCRKLERSTLFFLLLIFKDSPDAVPTSQVGSVPIASVMGLQCISPSPGSAAWAEMLYSLLPFAK